MGLQCTVLPTSYMYLKISRIKNEKKIELGVTCSLRPFSRFPIYFCFAINVVFVLG